MNSKVVARSSLEHLSQPGQPELSMRQQLYAVRSNCTHSIKAAAYYKVRPSVGALCFQNRMRMFGTPVEDYSVNKLRKWRYFKSTWLWVAKNFLLLTRSAHVVVAFWLRLEHLAQHVKVVARVSFAAPFILVRNDVLAYVVEFFLGPVVFALFMHNHQQQQSFNGFSFVNNEKTTEVQPFSDLFPASATVSQPNSFPQFFALSVSAIVI